MLNRRPLAQIVDQWRAARRGTPMTTIRNTAAFAAMDLSRWAVCMHERSCSETSLKGGLKWNTC
jgi:hypothetical protein